MRIKLFDQVSEIFLNFGHISVPLIECLHMGQRADIPIIFIAIQVLDHWTRAGIPPSFGVLWYHTQSLKMVRHELLDMLYFSDIVERLKAVNLVDHGRTDRFKDQVLLIHSLSNVFKHSVQFSLVFWWLNFWLTSSWLEIEWVWWDNWFCILLIWTEYFDRTAQFWQLDIRDALLFVLFKEFNQVSLVILCRLDWMIVELKSAHTCVHQPWNRLYLILGNYKHRILP